MRMWLGVDPKLMCEKHLSGEHVEMHMFVGSLAQGKSIDGYIIDGLIELGKIKERHDLLAAEITARGRLHATPIRDEPTYLSFAKRTHGGHAMTELVHRCITCRERIETTHGKLWPLVPYGGDKLLQTSDGNYRIQLAGLLIPDFQHLVRARALRKMELLRRDRQGMRKLKS